VLATRWSWPPYAIRPVLARLKTMSGLAPAPASEPLDSHIEYGVIYGREVEFRVSTLPSMFGEKAVLRVLDRSKGDVSFAQLGFEPDVYEVTRRNFESPTGLILVTGPTGSGKTTTLYSALEMINQEGVNVVTAEDPIESKIDGATQVNCGEGGITFAAALRSFLRQDPDIIMVGEIRDGETATIALRAALTGHLVLSTLHTNDAAGTIMRLTNMGLEPFLVGAALRMVVAQRLVRTLCSCRQPVPIDDATRSAFEQHEVPVPEEVFEPAGCDRCQGGGYKGRCGLYEVLDVDEEVEGLIVRDAPVDDIRAAARAAGTRSVFQDGLIKVAAGRTTLAEVHRVAAES
jgi:type IV pilus assembly protein PilB